MIVIFCHKKDFRQVFDTISVFCDVEFWSSFASIYGPILGSFYYQLINHNRMDKKMEDGNGETEEKHQNGTKLIYRLLNY